MENKTLYKCIFGAALLLLAACTQDELAEQGNTLPEGKYPLQIGSVTLVAEVDGQPWSTGAPQTRVSESNDRGSSHWSWNDTEQIGVQIEGSQKSGIYKLTRDMTVEPATSVYWEDKQKHKIRAWYPADGNVDLSKQSAKNGLAYALYAETAEAVDYNTQDITLLFEHKLAKVRVVLTGDKKDDVTDVQIKTRTSCTLNANGTLTAGSTEDFIPMERTTYNGAACWEANVVPGHEITQVKVNENESTLTNPLIPKEAKVNTIMLTVKNAPLQPGDDGKFTVNAGDDVIIKDYNGTAPIVVNGDATVTIENVQLTTEGAAMTINNGADVTLNVVGTGNSLTSQNGSGIGAYENSNICIKGTGSAESQLNVISGQGKNVGIGFIINNGNGTFGNIEISDVTLSVQSDKDPNNDDAGSAIGMTGRMGYNGTNSCGNIMISNSTITAGSKGGAACIGTGYWNVIGGHCSLGIISIENSTITATTEANDWGDNAACIGMGAVGSNCKATVQKIEIKKSTLHLTTSATYKVGKGSAFGTATITEGIFVDGKDKGKDGWNP